MLSILASLLRVSTCVMSFIADVLPAILVSRAGVETITDAVGMAALLARGFLKITCIIATTRQLNKQFYMYICHALIFIWNEYLSTDSDGMKNALPIDDDTSVDTGASVLVVLLVAMAAITVCG